MTESVSNIKGLIKKILKDLKEQGEIDMWAVTDDVTPHNMYRVEIWINNQVRFTSAVNNACHFSKIQAWNELMKLLIKSALKK